MKKFIAVLITVLAVILLSASLAMAAPNIKVDNDKLNFDVQTQIKDGRTLVPLRAIFEALGADVDWRPETNTVVAKKGDTEIQLPIGQIVAVKNGNEVELDVPAQVVKGRTLVPLRFVSESLGASVEWDGETQTITITSSGKTPSKESTSESYKVHFIDVGQGDCIYLELANDNDVLIDAGDRYSGDEIVSYLNDQNIDDIELLVASHPHADHLGGMDEVFEAFEVEEVVDSGVEHTSQTYKSYWDALQEENAEYSEAGNQSWEFNGCTFEVVHSENTDDLNNASVVTKLECQDISFLFTGDVEKEVERNLLDKDIEAEILKVPHHGSRSSSTSSFLSEVNTEKAIMCVGENNRYGHPHSEAIERLNNAGADIFSTAEHGDIVISVSGRDYEVMLENEGEPVEAEDEVGQEKQEPAQTGQYVGSKESDKYHNPDCRYAEAINPENEIWFEDKADARAEGYEPCGVCRP